MITSGARLFSTMVEARLKELGAIYGTRVKRTELFTHTLHQRGSYELHKANEPEQLRKK